MSDLTVAVVGDNTIDRYVGRCRRDFVGGNAVNVAVQLAERGFDVHYFGAVGPDQDGERIREELIARGVSVDGLITMAGRTALTLISVDESGDRHLDEEYFGVTTEYFPSDEEIRRIAQAAWVQIGMLPRAGEFCRKVRAVRSDVPIGQDCTVSDGYVHLEVAFESGRRESAHATATSALADGAALAVVTLGREGSMAFGPDGVVVEQAARPTEVVDTTGAGDSFIAGFIAARLQSLDLAAAMSLGAEWAARTCSHVGGFQQGTFDV